MTTPTMTTYDLARKQGEYRTAAEGNALVNQKNTIIEYCNAYRFTEAASLLRFAAPLWQAMNYGYKVGELRQRIIDGVNANLAEVHPRSKRAKDLENARLIALWVEA